MKKALGQTVRDLKRGVNKKVLKVPGLERKVLDATSNEAWGPHGSHLADIAQASRNHTEFQMIMGVLWKRLSDTGKNWRHVYKALIVLEYLVANGSERVIEEIKEHAHQIATLSEFHYIDSSGRDQGSNVRRKSQSLVLLVTDKDRVQEIRQKASANRDKFGKPDAYTSPGRYGEHYNEENRNGYGKDDRYGKYGDASSRDGDSETRYSRDGSVDDEHQERGRNSIGGKMKSEIDGNHADDDDGNSSSRGRGVRPDDHSQGGRNEKNSGEPPSYEEAVSEGRSSVHSERSGDPTVAAPRPTSPPHTSSTAHITAEHEASKPIVTNGPVDYDEFDPRGPASASAVPSNGAVVDLLGSFSEPSSHDSAIPQSSSAPDSGVNVLMDSGSAATFSATSSSFSQPFDDPFGDGPFRAIPSTDGNFSQTQSSPSFQTTTNQGLALLPAQSVGPQTDNPYTFDYGTPFGDISSMPNDQFSSANTQIVPQGFHDQETDILAGILPPIGFVASPSSTSQDIQTQSGQSFESSNAFGGYHEKSGDMSTVTSHLADLSPNRQTGQANNDLFSHQGFGAPPESHMNSQIATHPHNQLDGGDFFQQLGSSVPTSMAPFGQTESNSHMHDGGTLQQSGSTLQVTSPMALGSPFGANMQQQQQHTNEPMAQQPSLSHGPDAHNYSEGFLQQSPSHKAPPQPNAHNDGGGFIQQHGALMTSQGQNDQNSQSMNDVFSHQQYTSATPGTMHSAGGSSNASTAPVQHKNGGYLCQPDPSQVNPNISSQQPAFPQIAPPGQREQIPQNHEVDFMHKLSASSSPQTSHVGTGSPFAPHPQQNVGGFSQQPASLGNFTTAPTSSMHMAPPGLKDQNLQNNDNGFPHQPLASTASGAPHMVPGSPYQKNSGFIQHSGSSFGNPPVNPQGQTESTAQNYNGGFPQQQQESRVAGQYNRGNFLQPSGSSQFSTRHVDSAPNLNHNGLGGIPTQGGGSLSKITPQPSVSSSTAGPLALVTQPTQDKFETKSTVWADTLSRGLVNLNISGSKTNPLADIGIDFDAINRKEKRMEKPAANPVVSTVNMGKAMGSGSGIGRAGATALRPSTSPMMNSGMNMGIGAAPGIGRGSGMAGYGGMNQQPMGGFGIMNQQPMGGLGGMNQQQQIGGFGGMNHQQQPMGGLGGMNPQQQMGGLGGMNPQQQMGGLGGMNPQQQMGGLGGVNSQQQMGGYGGVNHQQQMGGYGGMNQNHQQQMGGFGGMNQQSMGMGFGPSAGMRPGISMGMHMGMGQGNAMQQPTGLPQGSPYNSGYNPSMGGGFPSQQPYHGGF